MRGLLCFTCNRFVLGKYATPAKLRAAADYLERAALRSPAMAERIHAIDAVTELDDLALHLQNASRANPGNSSSVKALRSMLYRPSVLDLLERLVAAERLAARG